ncbi:MAG: hypothetical protein H7X71_06960 [Chitinophagales bacterium]|nr:hypothetical protein [Chitinophagales bacterium]
MYRSEKIENVIARLVTGVAMSFPVAYINTISLFKQGNIVAMCNWVVNEDASMIYPDKLQPAYVKFFPTQQSFSDVEVTGIDTSGQPFTIFSPVNDIIKQTAA